MKTFKVQKSFVNLQVYIQEKKNKNPSKSGEKIKAF